MQPAQPEGPNMAKEEANGAVKKDDGDFVVVDNFARNHPEEELERYRGNWVAWSPDGTKVLAAHPDGEKLFDVIDAAGLKPGEYVLGAIEAEW
jgi:hypothetical protein